MKQDLSSEKKRKRTPKEPRQPESKDKQIMSDEPKKPSGKGKRTRVCDIYNDVEDQFSCMERAAIMLEQLDAGLPMFGKCMLPSNVLYSFWLILPKNFCVMHLPDNDATVTLVDEFGKEYKTNYLKARHGLSAGWRGFSNAQKLLQGDILFFHLVEPCKLRVHIVRRYGLEMIEAAICLMDMQPRVKRTRISNFEKEGKPKKEKQKRKKAKKEKSGESKKEKLKQEVTKDDDYTEKDQPEKEEPMIGGARKGKRTRRRPKTFIGQPLFFCQEERGRIEEDGQKAAYVDSKPLGDHQCDNSSDTFGSEVLEGSTSEMTNHMQPDELGSCGLKLACHESMDCESTTQRIYDSSTIAT